MTAYGFQWTQSTVSAVERGERALKASEAAPVAEALQVPMLFLLRPEAQVIPQAVELAAQVQEARRELESAVKKMLEVRSKWNRLTPEDKRDLQGFTPATEEEDVDLAKVDSMTLAQCVRDAARKWMPLYGDRFTATGSDDQSAIDELLDM